MINQTPVGLYSAGLMSVLAPSVAQPRFQRQHSTLIFVAKYTPIDFPSLFSTEPCNVAMIGVEIFAAARPRSHRVVVIVYPVSLDVSCWKGVSEG